MIPDRTEQLEKLHLEHIVRPAESQKTNGHLRTASTVLTDEEVLALCRKARNAPKFENLYDRGDLADYDGDESRADQALMSMLAFYTQDVDQLDSLFRGSALYRPEKWGRRADYRKRTIEKALGNLAETYGSKAVAHYGTNGHGSSSSQRPNLTYIGVGRWDANPRCSGWQRLIVPDPGVIGGRASYPSHTPHSSSVPGVWPRAS